MSPSATPRIRPPALRIGDTIGVIAPASNIKRGDLEAGCEALRRAGYRPFHFESILEQDIYFAGSLERRAHELEEMFVRDEVRAIVCARGGYGANYLLEALDFERIKTHPKILVGYSDITTLLTYVLDAAGMVTFHGPMVAKDWAHADGVDMKSWQAVLSGVADCELGVGSSARGLIDGSAEGVLYGGCLSLLVASLGTPYEIRPEGSILFLEDLAAKPFQIDRMLMQLKLARKFNGVRGIVFGQMLDCMQNANQGYTLEEVVLRIVGELGVPIAYGFKSGHVTSGNITLPFGVRAALNVGTGQTSLKLLEAAVQG